MREKVGPVLATRDFNLIPRHAPSALQAGGRQDGLSAGGAPPGAVRPGPAPFLHHHRGPVPGGPAALWGVGGGCQALALVHQFGAVLTCLGSCVGVLLAYYLTSVDAYGSLSPLNLLVFLLFWLAPVWF